MRANHGEHGGHGVFWAIEEEMLDSSLKAVHGPFKSENDASNFILQDFSNWWKDTEIPIADRDEECCGSWLILKQVTRVRPVGSASLKVKLVEEAK
jgi:hypothetical protein